VEILGKPNIPKVEVSFFEEKYRNSGSGALKGGGNTIYIKEACSLSCCSIKLPLTMTHKKLQG